MTYPIVSHRVAFITTQKDVKIFTTSSIYQVFFPRIVTYGKNYRAVQILTISADGTEGYATVQLPNHSDHDRYVVNPIFMDAMLHVAGFIANMRGNTNDAFICSKVGCVEVDPRLIDDSASYGVYVNCAWLPGGDMLAESYALEQGPTSRIVAHFEGIYFRKVPLTTLEYGLTLAAAPILPEPSNFEGTAASSGPSLASPFSQYFPKVKPGVMLSRSRALSYSASSPVITMNPLDSIYSPDPSDLSLSRYSIKAATVGNTPAVPRRNSVVEVSPCGDALVKQLSDPDPGDNTCQSDVKTLLAAILGLEEKELHEDTELELLGLDSLASIEAHHALQSHFSVLLPSDLFATHTSAKAIQSFITRRRLASCESPNRSTHSYYTDTTSPTTDGSELVFHLDTIPVSVQRTRLSGRAPLFLIHDGSGLVKYVHSIPPLDRDLWGIHNPYFINSRPWESVVSMAAEYAKYTTKVAGLGPILLGGWNLVSSETHR